MKTTFVLLFLLVISNANAQDSLLFQYDWKLEKLVTSDSILIVPENKFFYGQFFNSSNNIYTYDFGYCNNLSGVLVYSPVQIFDVSQYALPTSPCGPNIEQYMLEDYFHKQFIFEQFMVNANNPFTYNFSYQNDLIYLDIMNSQGSTATFYDALLSQEQFLEKSISIYPNPVDKVLHIDPANVGIRYLEVFDLQGRLIIKASEVQDNQIDVSALPQGIYILKIETDKGIMTKKLVKSNY